MLEPTKMEAYELVSSTFEVSKQNLRTLRFVHNNLSRLQILSDYFSTQLSKHHIAWLLFEKRALFALPDFWGSLLK